MWIEVLARFEDRPHIRQVVVYKPGTKCSVTRKCGNAAIKAGKAVEIPPPSRDEVKNARRSADA